MFLLFLMIRSLLSCNSFMVFVLQQFTMPLSGTLISEAKRSEEIVSCGDEIVGLRGWGDAGEESARSTYHSAAESRLTAP